jgi:hypothetical protein
MRESRRGLTAWRTPKKKGDRMTRTAQCISALACILACFGFTSASGDAAAKYPFIVVQPDTPNAEKDSVVLQIMRGRANNSCLAPTYAGVSFSIEMSPLTIYPPLFTVTVQYKEIPPPKDKVCPDVYNPVDYGPVFKLGVLKLGSYAVVDSNKTVGTFIVVKKGEIPLYAIKGKVIDDPSPLKRMGLPIPDVQIVVMKRVSRVTTSDPASISNIPIPETPVCTAKTGSNGEFAVSSLASGLYRLYCTHPDFNPATLALALKSDTSVTITMVATTASAAITGLVTEIVSSSGVAIARKPVEACTVQVERPAIYYIDGATTPSIEPGLPSASLRTITDKNGAYTISKIPIAYNGEKWLVRAFKSGYSTEVATVALYNMRTDSVNFDLQPPFTNTASKTVDGIIYSIATNKSLYLIGEGIVAQYAITNTTNTAVKFSPFAMQCEYDMTIATAAGRKIFQLSDVTECLESFAPVEITVKPGETVIKNFPTYYLPEVSTADMSNQQIASLLVSGRLRGEKYDFTEVLVGIKVQNVRTPAVPDKGKTNGLAPVTCVPARSGIELILSEPQAISCAVYALDGKINRDLSFKKELASGSHLVSFPASEKGNGVYIVKISSRNYSRAFKIHANAR